MKDAAFGNNPGGGYGALPTHPGYEEGATLYSGDDEEDFFEREAGDTGGYGSTHVGGSSGQQNQGAGGAKKKDDDWDKWDKDGGW